MEHTKGPWAVVNDVITGVRFTNPNLPICIGRLYTPVDGNMPSNFKTQEANAKLIAAAPELLDACQIVMEHISGLFGEDDADVQLLWAAVNKATT